MDMFESILGNESIKSYLRKAIEEERLPHALLFSGLSGIGKSLFAKELAVRVLRTSSDRIEREGHPDFHVLRPEGKSGTHSIESLRHLIDDVHAAPFEGHAKFFVIYDAERMQPAAANALLKTLEEPSPFTMIVLVTCHPQEMLATIVSRCSPLRFHPLSEIDIATILKAKGLPEQYAFLAQGSAEYACELAQKPALEKLLFPLLEQKHPYAKLSSLIEKIDEAIEDEDPLKQARSIERLFAAILMWHRDQIAREHGLSEDKLFFPEAPIACRHLPELSDMEKLVDEARLAISRNIRFSSCLEKILLSF